MLQASFLRCVDRSAACKRLSRDLLAPKQPRSLPSNPQHGRLLQDLRFLSTRQPMPATIEHAKPSRESACCSLLLSRLDQAPSGVTFGDNVGSRVGAYADVRCHRLLKTLRKPQGRHRCRHDCHHHNKDQKRQQQRHAEHRSTALNVDGQHRRVQQLTTTADTDFHDASEHLSDLVPGLLPRRFPPRSGLRPWRASQKEQRSTGLFFPHKREVMKFSFEKESNVCLLRLVNSELSPQQRSFGSHLLCANTARAISARANTPGQALTFSLKPTLREQR